eukprot:3102263-Pyramimonas_sp.AAC.1
MRLDAGRFQHHEHTRLALAYCRPLSTPVDRVYIFCDGSSGQTTVCFRHGPVQLFNLMGETSSPRASSAGTPKTALPKRWKRT